MEYHRCEEHKCRQEPTYKLQKVNRNDIVRGVSKATLTNVGIALFQLEFIFVCSWHLQHHLDQGWSVLRVAERVVEED
mgnify:CR=1 FL=1